MYSPDTIEFQQRRKWLTFEHPHWTFRKSEEVGADAAADPTITAYHKIHKNLMVRGTERGVTSVKVPSLPTLLYGHNGKLFRTDCELRLGYEVGDRILSEICRPLEPISKYTRWDVSFQCYTDTLDIIDATRMLKPRGGSKAASIKEGESIRFDLGRAQVEFYDKVCALKRKKFQIESEQNMTRCETRCRNKDAVHKYYGPDLLEYGPSIAILKAGVLKMLTGWFPAAHMRSTPRGIYEFLVEMERRSPGAIELYKREQSPATRKDIDAKVKRVTCAKFLERIPLLEMVTKDDPKLLADLCPTKGGQPVSPFYRELIDGLRSDLADGSLLPSDLGGGMHPFPPLDGSTIDPGGMHTGPSN